jgi:CheY-like chemotaxis protein
MPGTNGAMVLAELKRGYPAHGLDAEAAIGLGAARTLAKPFKRADLLRAVVELLACRAP